MAQDIKVEQSVVEFLEQVPGDIRVEQAVTEILQRVPGDIRVEQSVVEYQMRVPGDIRVEQCVVEWFWYMPTIPISPASGVLNLAGLTSAPTVSILHADCDEGISPSFSSCDSLTSEPWVE